MVTGNIPGDVNGTVDASNSSLFYHQALPNSWAITISSSSTAYSSVLISSDWLDDAS